MARKRLQAPPQPEETSESQDDTVTRECQTCASREGNCGYWHTGGE